MLTTLHALLGELEGRSTQISGMNLKLSLADGPLDGKLINLANVPADLDRVARAVETLVSHAGFSIADAEVAVRNLVNERHFYENTIPISGEFLNVAKATELLKQAV
jgi:hypothetical protein